MSFFKKMFGPSATQQKVNEATDKQVGLSCARGRPELAS